MSPALATPGIHHVTAFADSPAGNIDFYSNLLGLRTIKITVNYDDPETYHLYFADRLGSPGTVMTFFPHPNARPGRHGRGQATATAFAVPPGSLAFWQSRLADAGVDGDIHDRFDERVLRFADRDGTTLELIESGAGAKSTQPWVDGGINDAHAIRGFHSVALTVSDAQLTIDFLREAFAFNVIDEADNRTRLAADRGLIGSVVDVVADPDAPRGLFGPGTVHHVAWRAGDEDELEAARRLLIDRGLNVTEIKNRNYFRSIYFREPGGVIFEIATDGPGFTVDESETDLGSGLRLPPWMEPDRAAIEKRLPPLSR
jgi:glyoxalase family protein